MADYARLYYLPLLAFLYLVVLAAGGDVLTVRVGQGWELLECVWTAWKI